MKRILILILTLLLLLGLTTGAMASTMYFDSGFSGTARTGQMSWDTTNVWRFGISAPLDNWFLGCDYTFLKAEDSVGSEITSYTVKGGYSFLNTEAARLTGTIGYYHQAVSHSNNIQISAITLGLDSDIKLIGKLSLGLVADYAVAGKDYQYYGTKQDLDSVFNYQAKLNYSFNDTFGVSIGRYYNSYKPTNFVRTSHQSWTAGLNFKF